MHPARAEARRVAALEDLSSKVDLILTKVSGEPLEPAEMAELLSDPKIETVAADQAKILDGQAQILSRLDGLEASLGVWGFAGSLEDVRAKLEQLATLVNAQSVSNPTSPAAASKVGKEK